MADEITYSIYIKLDNGTREVERATGNLNITQTGTDFVFATQNIGTSAEAIAQGDIGTPGLMLVQNLAAAGGNYVEIGYDDTGFKPTVRINAQEWALFRHTQAAPQAKADTGAVDIQYLLIEA